MLNISQPLLFKITEALFIPMILLLFSCGSNSHKQKQPGTVNIESVKKDTVTDKKPTDTTIEKPIVYQSEANGLADIRLAILPDGNFTFDMEIIPQPMTDDDVSIINSGGKWTKNSHWVQLAFENDKLYLKAIFDIKFADKNQFKVLDSNTVKLNIGLDEIILWGINCTKTIPNDENSTELHAKHSDNLLSYLITQADSIQSQHITESCAVLIYPTEQQINSEKEKIGEEDFYTIAGDYNFYMGNLIEPMQQLEIKTITAQKRILKFQGTDKDYIIDLDKKGSLDLPYWKAILFTKSNAPIFIEVTDTDNDKIINYMKSSKKKVSK